MSLNPTGLYLHIPFCSVKCRFCDFAAFPGRKNDIPRYLQALKKDISVLAENHPRRVLDTVYVGGGTPSLVAPEDWTAFWVGVRECFDVSPNLEASLECNPDGVTEEKLAAWRGSGMNRLSFGLQSDDPALLTSLGRTHTYQDLVRVMGNARSQGFQNINVDLMYGLPGQTVEGWIRTVHHVLEMKPEHLSAYALQVEESTYYHRSGVQSDDDLQADMYETAADILESAGYRHYEISNFARAGFDCRHNLRYWRNQECLGAGVSAARYDGVQRHTNTDDLTSYMDSVFADGRPLQETVSLSPDEREGEHIMLGLRLHEGVCPSPRGQVLFGKVLDRSVRDGLLVREGDRYRPTRRGWRLSNQIFVDLLSA